MSFALISAAFSTPEITKVSRLVCFTLAFEGTVVGVGVTTSVGTGVGSSVGLGASPFTVTVNVFLAVAAEYLLL